MINYGIVYGLSDFGLADRLNIPREEAKEFIDTYLERFPALARFMVETFEQAREQGEVRTCGAGGVRSPSCGPATTRSHAGRTAGRQHRRPGTAADIIKLAMVRTHRALADAGLRTRLLLTIHDELLFEGPPGEAAAARELIEREMVAVWSRATAAGGRHRPGPHLAGRQVSRRGAGREPLAGRARRRRRRLPGGDAGADQLAPGQGGRDAARGDLLVPGRHRSAAVITSIVNGGLGASATSDGRPGGRWSAACSGHLRVGGAGRGAHTRGRGADRSGDHRSAGGLGAIDRFGLLGVAGRRSARSA